MRAASTLALLITLLASSGVHAQEADSEAETVSETVSEAETETVPADHVDEPSNVAGPRPELQREGSPPTASGTETETDADSDADSAEPELSAEDLAAITAATTADQAALEESDADATATGDDGDDLAGDGLSTMARVRSGLLQNLNPDLSFILDVAFGWFSDEAGNLQTGAHDPLKNGFNLQQLELSVSATVDPYFRVDGNIVFAQFGVEIEEFYGTTLALPAQLQMRAGQFLTKFGRANTTHPHTWDFVDQPIALGRVMGGEGNRGLGAELSWLTPLPWYVELIVSATSAAGQATARSFYGPNDLGVRTLADLQYTAALKSFHPLSDDWSLFWGLSSAFGPNGTGRDNRSELYGADLYLKWRPISRQSFSEVTLTVEGFYRRRQIPADVLSDFSMYAALFWRVAQRWALAGRYELGTPAVGLDGEASQEDYLDPEWIDNRHRVAANVTFFPTEFSRLRLQGSVDIPEWRGEPIWAGFLAMEFVTGAHGAHEF